MLLCLLFTSGKRVPSLLTPARHADCPGHEPFPKPAALMLPTPRLAQPKLEGPALCAPVESWPITQERRTDHPGSLWSFPPSHPPRSGRSRVAHHGALCARMMPPGWMPVSTFALRTLPEGTMAVW